MYIYIYLYIERDIRFGPEVTRTLVPSWVIMICGTFIVLRP